MSNDLVAANKQQPYVFATAASFETAQRIATALSKSDLVPKEYKNNLPNSLIALEIAQRTGSSPLLVMQNLYIVHGKPSWSSQFIIAAINSCGRFKPLRFDMTGTEGSDARTCVAWTVERGVEIPSDIRTLADARKANMSVLESPPVSIDIAKKEGWFGKQGSKWQTMPELMLRYRAATFFGRLYAPDVLMGMQTMEEIHDIGPTMKDATPTSSAADAIAEELRKEAAQTPKVSEIDPATGEVVTGPALQDMLDDIASAPTTEGVEFKASAAMEAYGTDANASAAISLAKTERKKVLAKPPVTPAAQSSDSAPQPSPSAAAGDGKPKGLFGKPVLEKKPEESTAA